MHKIIEEGKVRIKIPVVKKISKEMDVFYNPVMKFNRDISILLLDAVNKEKLNIALPLAGTGVRGIRFLKELDQKKIKEICFNDYSIKSIKLIKQNLKLNKIKKNKIKIYNKDANLFLLNSNGFDYIDIDPFGSPNFLLDSAIKRLARQGILAVTATDTSCLCGTYSRACIRKYWAIPKRDSIMHETGLRILIRKVQLIGAQYNKALIPVFSYSRDHYFRIFFKVNKGKKKVDKILKEHGMFNESGPMWLGKLWDNKLVNKMYKSMNKESLKIKSINNKSLKNFLKIVKDESKINIIGFYDIHKICKKYKIKQIPKKELLLKKIRNIGYKATETHFNPLGIRSDIELKKLLKIIRKL